MAKKNFIPAISIIIPMYNAEKYIGACLESVRAQTFQDFEVVVVDDCSTDGSREVVKNFSYNRGGEGELRLVELKKNSGGPGTPRNVGIDISRGEYLMFLDSDDAITKTALEELYKTAEKYKVDVVHCAEYFFTEDGTISTDKKILQKRHMYTLDLVNKPTFYPNDLAERVKLFSAGKFWTGTCNYFFHRDFLARNEIRFPKIKIAEDVPFAFFVSCLAESIITAPICYYVYRIMEGTNSKQAMNADEVVKKRGSSIFKSLECLNKFMDGLEFFRQNPEYRYAALDFSLMASSNFPTMMNVYQKISAPQLDNLLRHELSQIADKDALTAYLFSRMTSFNVQFFRQQEIIKQLQARR